MFLLCPENSLLYVKKYLYCDQVSKVKFCTTKFPAKVFLVPSSNVTRASDDDKCLDAHNPDIMQTQFQKTHHTQNICATGSGPRESRSRSWRSPIKAQENFDQGPGEL